MMAMFGLGGAGEATGSSTIGPWRYSSIQSWEIFWPGFPIIAYFKEDQTRKEGRRHVFFVIADGKAMYSEMLKRFGGNRQSRPTVDEWDDLRPLSPIGFKRLMVWMWGVLLSMEIELQLGARLVLLRASLAAKIGPIIKGTQLPLVAELSAACKVAVKAAAEAYERVAGNAARP